MTVPATVEIQQTQPGTDSAPLSPAESAQGAQAQSTQQDPNSGNQQSAESGDTSGSAQGKKSPKLNGKVELSKPAGELFADAERKLTEDPSYQLTREEIEAFEQTRDEKFGKTEVSKPAPHNNPAIQKAMDYVGAKTVEELPAKVESLRKEFNRVNGERGKMPQLNQLQENMRGQHNLIADMLAGKPEAFAYAAKIHGLDPSKIQAHRNGASNTNPNPAAGNNQQSGGRFDTYLDPEVAKHMDEVEGKLRELDAVKEFMHKEMDQRTLSDARTQTLNEISEIVAMAPEIFDTKKHGSLRSQMDLYWNTNRNDPVPESTKRVIEVLQIAAEHGFNTLKPAYEMWAWRNRGALQSEAARSATQAFTGKRASVGLSDQQQGRSGSSYSQADVQKIADGDAAMPSDWVDQKSGRLLVDKMPPEVKNLILAGKRS
jgi:hypothetical protein